MRTLGGFSDDAFKTGLSDLLVTKTASDEGTQAPVLLETEIVQNSGTNSAPFFTEPAVFSVEEDDPEVSFSVQAFDPDGDSITFLISGGDDAGDFEIDAATGEITFLTTPDFQSPDDADGDNTYTVQITASDGRDTATLDIQVHVAEVPAAPVDIEILRPEGFNPFSPVIGFLTPFSGGTLMEMKVQDDAGQASGTTFSLMGEDAFQFDINANTGQITLDETVFLGGDGAPNADFSDLSFDGDAVYEVLVMAEHDSGTQDMMAVDFFLFIGG